MLFVAAVASGVATFFGSTEFFRSLWFLIPCVLFALSLLTCTADSLIRRPRRRLTGYAAPAIHIGVLILLMGGFLTLLAAREELITLEIGESVTIRDEWRVTLLDSERRPENWYSRLQITPVAESGDGSQERSGSSREVVVSVNHPHRVGPVRLLQHSWENSQVLLMEDESGSIYTMSAGEGFASGETVIILEEAPESDLGLRFARFTESRRAGSITIEAGMRIAELVVVGSEERIVTGLLVAYDPGAPFALAGAVLLSAGLLLYLKGRMGEEG